MIKGGQETMERFFFFEKFNFVPEKIIFFFVKLRIWTKNNESIPKGKKFRLKQRKKIIFQ